ncbi:DNA-binding protein [Dyella halodurans]|uniref:Plasmid-related protein n=1 Tax=Dyella halodurans TaxID=1920171 RepID=A0ABV9BZZ3_9GAMM|nr:DNA-binding protein [Dyella halodurans]
MTRTEELLFDRYGSPLLPLDAVAEILGRSTNGLRVSLSSNNEMACKLRSAKVKLGRRIYFRMSEIARLIDEA